MDIIYQQVPTSLISHIYLVLPRTGYCLDPPSRSGLTRMTLRMLEQGAANLDAQAFNAQLEELGANLGHMIANDHVYLCLSVLTENIEKAIALFAKAIFEPQFKPQSLAQLKQELVSAWIAERQESKRLRATEVLFANLHQGNLQGNSPDGNPLGLNSITSEDIHSLYQTLFTCPETFLAATSNLPKKQLETLLLPITTPLIASQSAPVAHPWDNYCPTTKPGIRITIIPEKNTNTDEILVSRFAANEADPDWYIQRIANLVLGGDMVSRLFSEVRNKRGYSYGASCSHDNKTGRSPRNIPAPFTIYTFPSAENTAKTLPLVLNVYREWAEKGISTEELQRVRQALTQSYPFQDNTPDRKISWSIANKLYGIRLAPANEHTQKLADLTTKDVLLAIQAVHDLSALEIVLLGDQKRLLKVVDAIPEPKEVQIVKYPQETTIST